MVSRFCCGDNATPGCHDNGDAGKLLGNPDIRVPESIEKEDGLRAGREKQGGNADGDEPRGNERAKDHRRNQNSRDNPEASNQARTERRAEGRELRHIPGGTWLTKDIILRGLIKEELQANISKVLGYFF
ncbi:hypothetical protein NDU88_011113 [Pleurodeles waltl]|uniref:Uncharacterized protein n=1 Tax=Pleurodeles waltl TaxID=8319 RepID=A0AAV7QYA4_PLEWA|nr:hypothetical protein NDU88_011113 [Pleurodeles waltl]